MINASTEFIQAIQAGRADYKLSITMLMTDGTGLLLREDEIWGDTAKLEDATAQGEDFTVGAFVSTKFSFSINNRDERYSDDYVYNFVDAELTSVQLGLDINGVTEWINLGRFWVDSVDYDGSLISFVCTDEARRFNRPYISSYNSGTATLRQLLTEVVVRCMGSSSRLMAEDFPHQDYAVALPFSHDSISCADVVAMIAQIAGCFAKFDNNGILQLKRYDFSIKDLSVGDKFKTVYAEQHGYHVVTSLKSAKIQKHDCVVTRVDVVEEPIEADGTPSEAHYPTSGSDDYVIKVSGNRLIAENHAPVASMYIAEAVCNKAFRPMSLSVLTNPLIEAGDVFYVVKKIDERGLTTDAGERIVTDTGDGLVAEDIEAFFSLVTSRSMLLGSGVTIECAGAPAPVNAQTSYTELSKGIAKERKVAEDRSAAARASLQKNIYSSLGLYETDEEQQDGSVIKYFHDKADKAASTYIWKFDADSIVASTDGGITWSTAIDANGNALLKYLAVDNLDADWIKAGTIDADLIKAGTISDQTGNSYWNLETGEIYISSIGDKVATSVEYEYGISDSPSVEPVSWSSGTPAWTAGKYIWQRAITVYSDGTSESSDPACIQGAAGTPGRDGAGVSILGTKSSVADLPATGSVGDAWMVGTDLYVWDAANLRWNNVGQIKGDKGDKGDTGARGATGATGAKGDKGDKGDTGATGAAGADGRDGRDGADGADGVGLRQITPLYAKNASMITPPSYSAFSEEVPDWEENKYIWTCFKIDYTDNTSEFSTRVVEKFLNTANQKWRELTDNNEELTRQYNEVRHDIDFSWLKTSNDEYIITSTGKYINKTAADAAKVGEDVTIKLLTQMQQTAEQIELSASETYTKKSETADAVRSLTQDYRTAINQTAQGIRLDAVLRENLDGTQFTDTAGHISIKADVITQSVRDNLANNYSTTTQTASMISSAVSGKVDNSVFSAYQDLAAGRFTSIEAKNAEQDKLAGYGAIATSDSTEANPVRILTSDGKLLLAVTGDIINRLYALNADTATAIEQTEEHIALVAANANEDIAALEVRAGEISSRVSDVAGNVSSVRQTAEGLVVTVGGKQDAINLPSGGPLSWSGNSLVFSSDGLQLTIGQVTDLNSALNGKLTIGDSTKLVSGLQWTNDGKLEVAVSSLHITSSDVQYGSTNRNVGQMIDYLDDSLDTVSGNVDGVTQGLTRTTNAVVNIANRIFTSVFDIQDYNIANFKIDEGIIQLSSDRTRSIFGREFKINGTQLELDPDNITLSAFNYDANQTVAQRFDQTVNVSGTTLKWSDFSQYIEFGMYTSESTQYPSLMFKNGNTVYARLNYHGTTFYNDSANKITSFDKSGAYFYDGTANSRVNVKISASGMEVFSPDNGNPIATFDSTGIKFYNKASRNSQTGVLKTETIEGASHCGLLGVPDIAIGSQGATDRLTAIDSGVFQIKSIGELGSVFAARASDYLNPGISTERQYYVLLAETRCKELQTSNLYAPTESGAVNVNGINFSSSASSTGNISWNGTQISTTNPLKVNNTITATGNISSNGKLSALNIEASNYISATGSITSSSTITAEGNITATNGVVYADGIVFNHTKESAYYQSGKSLQWDGSRLWVYGGFKVYGSNLIVDGGGADIGLDLNVYRNGGIAGDLTVQGTINGQSIGGSDARLKKNISPSTLKALEALTAVDMKSYDWIKDGRHVETGIIAQQLQTIAPDLVTASGENETLGIRTQDLLYYCVKAIQELADLVGYKPTKKAAWTDPYTLEDKLKFNELISHTK